MCISAKSEICCFATIIRSINIFAVRESASKNYTSQLRNYVHIEVGIKGF